MLPVRACLYEYMIIIYIWECLWTCVTYLLIHFTDLFVSIIYLKLIYFLLYWLTYWLYLVCAHRLIFPNYLPVYAVSLSSLYLFQIWIQITYLDMSFIWCIQSLYIKQWDIRNIALVRWKRRSKLWLWNITYLHPVYCSYHFLCLIIIDTLTYELIGLAYLRACECHVLCKQM